MQENAKPVNLAILLSGSGRTLLNFIERIKARTLPARIVVVISSVKDAYGLERARQHGIPNHLIERPGYKTVAGFSEAIVKCVAQYPVDLVVMAGFIHLFKIPAHFKNRVMNIHPALLPKYGGKGMYYHHVHEAVLKAGEKESGCTVHFADNVYDHGPIIVQRRVAVQPGDTPDTLAAKVFAEECVAYPEAITLFAQGKVNIP
ncbi:MAG: phosphoribosylglycinamide formyltransferase [Planctomycetota bacterium]|nr:phosphoribosylglycinamide formyltransferase [Planctomycetota bacterium]